jgi:hypothetical protein
MMAAISAALFSPALLADDWSTPAERTQYRTTPDYAETMAYLERIQAAAPGQVKIEKFGETGEGLPLTIVIVSKDGIFDPAQLHAQKRPILLVQNSIHAGEMDGKDACLALLRDMVISKTRQDLLDRAVLVFIPVYNLDGHERRSAYNRINQNGPALMGWRATGTNLNLNRDYLKAQAPETRALIALINRFRPDFFVDNHVTDGTDYQYDVTFSIDNGPNVPEPTVRWVDDRVTPELTRQIDTSGHLAAPTYIILADDSDPSKGLGFNDDPPRYSTGYMILQNRPGMLVELHMLKDYKTRVTGNYQLLKALMAVMNQDADRLIALNLAADRHAMALPGSDYPLALAWDGVTTTPFPYRGYHYTRQLSAVSGAMMISYDHTPFNQTLALQSGFKVTASTRVPAAYLIPRQWSSVIDVLTAQGVQMHPTSAAWSGSVETYRCADMVWNLPPFEGRHPLFAGEGAGDHGGQFGHCDKITATMDFPAGSMLVPLDQRLSQVALAWLEPEAPDSALRWGFFDAIFEQKETGEAYVLEPLARKMMADDARLKAEFEHRVESDRSFAADPSARLSFFYDRSPWRDPQLGLYPVGRLENVSGVPVQP